MAAAAASAVVSDAKLTTPATFQQNHSIADMGSTHARNSVHSDVRAASARSVSVFVLTFDTIEPDSVAHRTTNKRLQQ